MIFAHKKRPKLAFVFPPRDFKWISVAQQLYREEPVFCETIKRCDITIQDRLGWSLVKMLQCDSSHELHSSEEYVEPALVALQIALSEFWFSKGIKPDATLGLSGGEFAAAYAAGVLTMKDTMKLACSSSLLMRQRLGVGKMLMVQQGSAEFEQLQEILSSPVYITGVYSNSLTVISGSEQSIEALLPVLRDRQIKCIPLRAGFALHSPIIDCWKEKFMEPLDGLNPVYPGIPIYSSMAKGKCVSNFDASHWWNVVRQPTYFNIAIQSLIEEGYDSYLEISLHSILLKCIKEVALSLGKNVFTLPSTHSDGEGRQVIGQSFIDLQN